MAIGMTDEFKKSARVRSIWYNLYRLIRNPYGVAGVMGNLYAESGLNPTNLQNSYEKTLGLNDEEYTKAVDSGRYKDFAIDGAGYGLAQWTYSSRKRNLEGFAKTLGMSIGDEFTQLSFLMLELQNYSYVLSGLRSALSVQQASDVFLFLYEKPASSMNPASTTSDRRAALSSEFYDALSDIKNSDDYADYSVLSVGNNNNDVRVLQRGLVELGYDLGQHGVDGNYGSKTKAAVAQFQKDHKLYSDGKAGAVTQYLVSYLVNTSRSRYTVTIGKLSHAEVMELMAKYHDAVAKVETPIKC